jgi:asparagine synthase (glutamine-hydrolysing)
MDNAAFAGATDASVPFIGPWHHAGGVSVACHGEIHNALQLCTELAGTADTPLLPLLALGWQRWSLGLFARLDGVFALALRDGDELLLYRDPSGLRNLYWQAGSDGTIGFASHLGALPRPAQAPQRLGRPSLHEYLRFLEVAPPHTLLHGAHAVEAGQALRWKGHGPAVLAHMPAVSGPDAPPSSFQAAVEGLDARLQRSVSVRLEGAARPAAFLSGGIDSALLCALAAREHPTLTAVTVGFDGVDYDETPVAQRIAGHLGIAHEVLRFSRAQFLDAFERLSGEAEQPMADPAAMATVLAFEHCRDRFDVVLDGTGADESVGTMPPRHVRLAVGHASRLPAGVRVSAARLLRKTPGLAGFAPVLDFEHPADTMSRWHGFTRLEIEQLCDEPVSLEHTQFFRTFQRYPRQAHFERYSALLNAMTCDRLNQALVISGAPVCFPFWDADTDRYIRQLRTDYRHLPGQPKRILRALLARYVPAELWDLPKHSFNFPLREFLIGDDFQLVRRHLEPERWQAHGLLNVQQLQRWVRQFTAGDERVTFRVWALVVLGAWLEKHKDRLDLSA